MRIVNILLANIPSSLIAKRLLTDPPKNLLSTKFEGIETAVPAFLKPVSSRRNHDSHLLGIDVQRNKCNSRSRFTEDFQGVTITFQQWLQCAVSFSVARVQPWTSKGITDLLLLNFMRLNTACPSKKLSGLAYEYTVPSQSALLATVSFVIRIKQTNQSTSKNGHAPPTTES
ncbi:unnamed protein product [Thelazia callipaeda]|uniref:Secreted protein n=1 Tax=Thelazia callipaeda TaxID=103827 RepID=A0A0N5CPB0_THECL|nr:unnamed protein product [Thelazia callipaeda]